MKSIKENATYILGVDIARLGEDSSVYIVLEKEEGSPIKIVFIDEIQHKLLTDAIGRIKILNSKFNFKKIYIDETGLGAGVVDVLLEEFGKYKIEAFTFTNKSKQDLYSNLKILMEQRKLKIPFHKKLFYQLSDLRYEVASSGNIKIHHSQRGKDDFCDALSLACMFFQPQNKAYKPHIA